MKMTKRKRERFVGIPYRVASHSNFTSLSAQAVKLLVDLSHQRNGRNNGALSACWTLMRERGWKSSSTLHKARSELIEKGFIVITRRGRKQRGYPTLVAVTWDGIDDTNIEYDEEITSSTVSLGTWRRSPDRSKSQPNLRVVQPVSSDFSARNAIGKVKTQAV